MAILTFFWHLCLLRGSPARLPSSNFAAGVTFAIYLVIACTVVTLIRPQQSLAHVLGDISIGVFIQALVTIGLLQYKGLVSRFRATWTSLLGTNAIMLLVLLPVNTILLNAESEALRMLADSLIWICLGWWLAIAGHIYHKSVHISVIQGSVIAFLIELISAIVAFNLVPR